jgi:Glyceraldehyde 3-phosphate dehydrogenase, C-terminal domain
MVITDTGAAKAAERALPQLKGKLTGSAVRVPTPTVSLAILSLNLTNKVDKDSLNEFMRESSLYSPLQNQIGYSSSLEAVSSDFVGNRNTGKAGWHWLCAPRGFSDALCVRPPPATASSPCFVLMIRVRVLRSWCARRHCG